MPRHHHSSSTKSQNQIGKSESSIISAAAPVSMPASAEPLPTPLASSEAEHSFRATHRHRSKEHHRSSSKKHKKHEKHRSSTSDIASAVPLPTASASASNSAETDMMRPANINPTSYQDVSALVAHFNSLLLNSAEKKACDKRLRSVLHRAGKYSTSFDAQTLKSILPMTKLYPDKVLNTLVKALQRDDLKTNHWIYIGFSSVLQMALVDRDVLTNIGQTSVLSLLTSIADLFNEKITIAPGDQTIPYLVLDVLNLCIMNVIILGTNPLPSGVMERLTAKLKAIKPHASEISNVIKMQRLFAEDMLQSISIDLGLFEKALPYAVPVAKVGLGVGLVGGAVGLIGGTHGAAASVGAKMAFEGTKLSVTGAWDLYKKLPSSSSNGYLRTLTTYILLAMIKEMSAGSEQEQDFKTLLQMIRREDSVKEYGMGLLGIIYRLVQLYPQLTSSVQSEIVQTLSIICHRPASTIATTLLLQSSVEPSIWKNAMMALRYLSETHHSPQAITEYQDCLRAVNNEKKLGEAIAQQYPFFCRLNKFFEDISREFADAEPSLLIEVLEEEERQASQLQAVQQLQDSSGPRIKDHTDVYGIVDGTVEAGVANATDVPADLELVKEVMNKQKEFIESGAKSGVSSTTTIHKGAKVGGVRGGVAVLHFAPLPSSSTLFASANGTSASLASSSTSASTSAAAASSSKAAASRPK